MKSTARRSQDSRRPIPWLIITAALLLALPACLCGGLGAPPPTTTPRPTPAGTPAPHEFTIVRIEPSGGDLNDQLKQQAAKAAGEKRTPYVEFDATWCPPCQAIKASLAQNDPLMVDAFAGAYIVQVDIDTWKDPMAKAGYDVPGIPAYWELDPSGKPTGRKIDGDAWGDNIPENMAPPLKAFFTGK